LISSESNEICSKEEKRTIAPEHVLRALEVRMDYTLGFMLKQAFFLCARLIGHRLRPRSPNHMVLVLPEGISHCTQLSMLCDCYL